MLIEINADRRALALVDGNSLPWVASPESGVERRMLERIGDEVAFATSIVRYAPGSRFAPHTHERGEEFLVLQGTFADENGEFAAGTYVRNPPGSRHAPFSVEGCVILVKLRQMLDDETEAVCLPRQHRSWVSTNTPGVARALLYSNVRSEVFLMQLDEGAELPSRASAGGEECFVIEGEIELLTSPRQILHSWSWRRCADHEQPAMRSPGGALLWIKSGHL